jgi:O-antigen ligase
VVAGFSSLVNAEQPELVFLELFRFGKLLLILFVVMNLRDDAQARRFVWLLSIGVFAQAIIAGLQYRYGQLLGLGILGEKSLVRERIGYTVSRATGTLGHPSILGYYLELQLPLLLAFLLTDRRLRTRLWYLLVTGAGLVALATTLSRGAWVALPVPMALVLLAMRRHRLLRLRTWLVAGTVFLIAAAALTPFYPTIERRLTHDDYKSAESRAPLNRAALSIVEQYPLLGVGLNHCAEVFHRYDTTGYARILKEKQVVHNLYLLVWVEVGTLGLVAFLGIFVVCFSVAGWLFFRESRGRQAILCGAVGGLLAHLIHGLFDPGFKVAANVSMLVYALLGLVGYVLVSRPPAETT